MIAPCFSQATAAISGVSTNIFRDRPRYWLQLSSTTTEIETGYGHGGQPQGVLARNTLFISHKFVKPSGYQCGSAANTFFLPFHIKTCIWQPLPVKLASRGVRIGGVSGAPYILARAGLLDGYRCTIHWEHRPAFIEAFPNLLVQHGLYVVDRNRLTCAGGTAGLDLAIELIATDHGPALATMVGDWYLRTQLRDASATQRMSLRERYNVNNEKLLGTLARMEANPEEPLDRVLLARGAGISVRQLERLFADHLGATIGSSYLNIRLARAMTLLKETSLATMDIATACGFVSTSHFSRAFKRRYGAPPSALRGALKPKVPHGEAPLVTGRVTRSRKSAK